MAPLVRLVRLVMGVAIVVALIAQYVHGSDRATFSAANFFSYFTVISNCLVAITFLSLAANRALQDGPRFSVFRGAVTLCIIATGLVYAVLLAPAAWYPYPFLDPDLESVASIVVPCIGITVVFVAFAAAMRWWAGRRAVAVPAVVPT